LLDHADLVFIDPVHTGYSRPLPGQKATDFLTFQKDIEWVAEFIRLYTTRNGRWLSPKYLIGESYGTTRAAGLAGHLQDRHGLYLNGIMLVSVVLNFQTLDFHPGNDLPHALYLPTYTATAWYHQRLPADLQGDLAAALNQARHFALNDYTLALMQGDALPPAKQDEIAAQLARFTGLSLDYIKQSNLRIDIMRFVKELLRDQRRTVGRLDSRFTGIDRDAAGESFSHDPSYAAIQGSYTATFNDYIRRHLNFEHDATYEILSFKTHAAWQYDTHQNRYVDVAETLRHAISTNPHLKIFVANGYYDLATPMLATEYTLNHLQLDPARRANITVHDYPAGHMMYIHPPSLAQMKTDLVAFLDR
ncbi:MAG TPA: peptidase S10, partial [Anaerolineae bacterium]|nr:peptidase S10 [Anaerolineae bacterium]